MSLTVRDKNVIVNLYNRLALEVSHCSGCYIYTNDGRKFLDMFAGLGVSALGHSHKDIINAIEGGCKNYLHISNFFPSRESVELAEMLIENTFADKVFFVNSGTETVETALKTARLYGNKAGKSRIIAFTGAYHGRTMGSLSLTGLEGLKSGFEPLLPGIEFAPFNDTDELEGMFDNDVAAVFLEPVQGAGGVVVAEDEFVQKINELCRKNDALLVFDEIQCGLGRPGRLFAYEHYGIEPDILCTAKALGGGLPLGATLMKEELAKLMQFPLHGSTFGGNPLCCRLGKVVLSYLIEKGLIGNVNDSGAFLFEGLNRLKEKYKDLIKSVRGIGLMAGIELNGIDMSRLKTSFLDQGILINTVGNVIRLLPPLIITIPQLETFLDSFDRIIENYQGLVEE